MTKQHNFISRKGVTLSMLTQALRNNGWRPIFDGGGVGCHYCKGKEVIHYPVSSKSVRAKTDRATITSFVAEPTEQVLAIAKHLGFTSTPRPSYFRDIML